MSAIQTSTSPSIVWVLSVGPICLTDQSYLATHKAELSGANNPTFQILQTVRLVLDILGARLIGISDELTCLAGLDQTSLVPKLSGLQII